MYLKSLTRPWKHSILNQQKILFGGFSELEQQYEKKTLEREKIKSAEIYKVNPQQLQTTNILTNVLVPNFFTDCLSLQKYPTMRSQSKKLNYFKNSYCRICLQLEQKKYLREKLHKIYAEEVRIGRIFQLMDSIAGIVSYTHGFAGLNSNMQEKDFICVTGSVQELHLFQPIKVTKNIIMEGYLNYVGKTSMEIEMNVFQEGQLKANSLFTMVARDAKNPMKGYRVPQLSLEGLDKEQEQKALVRQAKAKENVRNRRLEIANSYDNKAPSNQEIQEVHKIFLQTKSQTDIALRTTPIRETVVSLCEIMHTQHRNVHGKIFGGFLIKEMIQLAWLAGCKYSQDEISIENLTNIYFKKPVDIGSRLTLKAMVTYVESNRIIITVQAYTSKMTERNEQLACYMHMIGKSKAELRKVHPESYQESLQYLSSHKVFQELFC